MQVRRQLEVRWWKSWLSVANTFSIILSTCWQVYCAASIIAAVVAQPGINVVLVDCSGTRKLLIALATILTLSSYSMFSASHNSWRSCFSNVTNAPWYPPSDNISSMNSTQEACSPQPLVTRTTPSSQGLLIRQIVPSQSWLMTSKTMSTWLTNSLNFFAK